MSKKTHLQKLKRERRLVDRDISRRRVSPRVVTHIHRTVSAIYSARPIGMIAWNEYKGDRADRVAIVVHADEPNPFARVLYSRNFTNAKLQVLIVDESELDGIRIDDPPVMIPKIVYYSMGCALAIDANPTEAQMEGLILD